MDLDNERAYVVLPRAQVAIATDVIWWWAWAAYMSLRWSVIWMAG